MAGRALRRFAHSRLREMFSGSECPDTECLKVSPFSKGEWRRDERVMLDVAFTSLAKVLGDDDDPLESISALRLLAIAYAVGWSDKMLTVTPVEFAGELESAIDARGGLVDIGAQADTNLATAQGVATDQIQLDAIKLYAAMYGTIDPFAARVTALPCVDGEEVDCSSFPRLAKLAAADGKVPAAKILSLASRLGVSLPQESDLSLTAKSEWVWGLAELAHSFTVRAAGWLRLAASQADFNSAVAELTDDGRFTVEWMNERRRLRAVAAEQERARRELGTGFAETLTPLAVWEHVSTAVRETGTAADDALASNTALALRKFHSLELGGADVDVMKMAAGTAVLGAMRRKGHGTDRLGVAPAGTAAALQYIVTYVVPVAPGSSDGGESAASTAATASTTGGALVQLGAESMAALQAAAGRSPGGAARDASDKLTLGKAPQEPHARRPEWFSPKDVAPFELHEAALQRLSKLEGRAFVDAWAELDPEARRLASVPVYSQDLARCPRLLALDLVYSKLTEAGDNILIEGTSLAGDRESEEQRNEDRARARLVAKLRQGDVITGGPQICVVHHRLASFWVFAQVPYQSGTIASSVNGVWDAAWTTWAQVAEMQLGEDCEIVPAVEMILKVVRKSSVSGHHQWPDQARCDYPGVAMWFFARDFRAYRERRLATKPSLLQIFQSTDYLTYFKMQLDFALNMHVRPDKMPYSALVIGSQAPKRPRPALEVADLIDDGAEADDEAKTTTDRKKKKPKPPKTPPKKQPKPAPKPAPHTRDADEPKGDYGARRKFDGGSAFPDNAFMRRHDIDDALLEVLQTKLDQSTGIDKGACVWCLIGPNGCPKDKRVGVQASCGRAHLGPVDRKPQFCIAVCKSTEMKGPLYLNNKKFWTKALSGHTSSEARPPATAQPAVRAPNTPVPSAGEDDDDEP